MHLLTTVLSASNKYTPRALRVAGIPFPEADIVTSNDVSHGKPHPEPYLAGALECGIDAKNCEIRQTDRGGRQIEIGLTHTPSGLVVEDAISGVKAGHAAGAKVLAVCTSTSRERLLAAAEPDFIVPDLRR